MKNNKLFQYAGKNKLHFSVQIFFTGMILSFTFFLLFIDACKTYSSSITILVNAKSEFSAKQQEQIIENILAFPHTLSFYDRLLKYNPDVRDITKGNSSDKRKLAWNKMLSVKRTDKNSSVIEISITAKQESDADQLAQKTVRTLFDFTGNYYDIKNDLDLRIIDGPIASAKLTGWYWILPLSILLGFFIAFVLENILAKSKGIFTSQRNFLKEKNFFDFKKELPETPQEGISELENLYMSEENETPFFTEEKEAEQIFPKENLLEKSGLDLRIKEMKKLTKNDPAGQISEFSRNAKKRNEKIRSSGKSSDCRQLIFYAIK